MGKYSWVICLIFVFCAIPKQESNLHESNLHVNIQGLVDEDPGDIGGGKLKGIGLEGNFTTPNLGNLPHISNFETSMNSNVP